VRHVERLRVNRQRLPVERLGLGVPARGLQQPREVVEAGGVGRVLRAERLRVDRQRLPVERLGLGVPAGGPQ